MPLTPGELLSILDNAIAAAPPRPPGGGLFGRAPTVLHLRVPEIGSLGERGRPMGDDPEGHPMYGFTLGQCQAMRERLLIGFRELANAETVEDGDDE